MTFADAILDCFGRNEMFINIDTGEKFQAMTETDLAYRLREKGWRLPRDFLRSVKEAGFTVKQVYQFNGRVARSYTTVNERGRALSPYNTLITL
jgi:hypothetical protein